VIRVINLFCTGSSPVESTFFKLNQLNMKDLKAYCVENNLIEIYILILRKTKQMQEESILKRKVELEKMGVIVYPSFEEKLRKPGFSLEDVLNTMKELGVSFNNIKSPNWWQRNFHGETWEDRALKYGLKTLEDERKKD
jgi:hypothetical protein